jgi:hypothetical protein
MPAVLKSMHASRVKEHASLASMVMCMSNSTSESQDEDSMSCVTCVCPTHQMWIACRCVSLTTHKIFFWGAQTVCHLGWINCHENVPLPNDDFGRIDKKKIRFSKEALFKGVTRFGIGTLKKSVENPHDIFCSSFQNLFLGSIKICIRDA